MVACGGRRPDRPRQGLLVSDVCVCVWGGGGGTNVTVQTLPPMVLILLGDSAHDSLHMSRKIDS